MKEITGVLQSETFRLFVVYILPGGLVVIPYYKVLPLLYPDLLLLIPDNDLSRGIALFCAATVVGMILEDLGSRLERQWDDTNTRIRECWLEYLCLKFDHEPIGQQYISGIQMRMKFELSTCIAIVLATIPISAFLWVHTSIWLTCLAIVLGLLCAWYLQYEARTSHAVLHEVREKLCSKLGVTERVEVTESEGRERGTKTRTKRR